MFIFRRSIIVPLVMTLPAWAASPLDTLQAEATALQNPVTAQRTDPASPAPDTVPAPAIDVSSLPAIKSIDAHSNVAVFLKPGVPEDLTRAALRKCWVSDPAIRDFVGISENQWDFNNEETIAGSAR